MKIANLFTGLRIALLVPLFWLLSRGPGWACLGVYLLAGVTDVADGWLARRLGQASSFGAFFDKLADRLLTITVAAGLIAFQPHATILVVIACLVLIMRDAIVASLNEFLPGQLNITVSWPEKIKITLNWLGFGLLMSPDLAWPVRSHILGAGLLSLSAALCLVILADYGGRARRAFRAI